MTEFFHQPLVFIGIVFLVSVSLVYSLYEILVWCKEDWKTSVGEWKK